MIKSEKENGGANLLGESSKIVRFPAQTLTVPLGVQKAAGSRFRPSRCGVDETPMASASPRGT